MVDACTQTERSDYKEIKAKMLKKQQAAQQQAQSLLKPGQIPQNKPILEEGNKALQEPLQSRNIHDSSHATEKIPITDKKKYDFIGISNGLGSTVTH